MEATHPIDPDTTRDMHIDNQLTDAAFTSTGSYERGQQLGQELTRKGADLDLESWLEYLAAEYARAEAIVDDRATTAEFRSAMAGYAQALGRYILENS